MPIGHGFGRLRLAAARAATGARAKPDRRRRLGLGARVPASFAALGRPVAPVTTRLADGMACRVPDDDALDIIRAGTERVMEVTDEEVEEAMRVLFADAQRRRGRRCRIARRASAGVSQPAPSDGGYRAHRRERRPAALRKNSRRVICVPGSGPPSRLRRFGWIRGLVIRD